MVVMVVVVVVMIFFLTIHSHYYFVYLQIPCMVYSKFIFTTTPFTCEKTESERGSISCPLAIISVAEPVLKPGLPSGTARSIGHMEPVQMSGLVLSVGREVKSSAVNGGGGFGGLRREGKS